MTRQRAITRFRGQVDDTTSFSSSIAENFARE
jgi:hypothetical protein